MNTETLKRAAEWMGNLPENLNHENDSELWYLNVNAEWVLFNPHEDFNLLKKMVAKLSRNQFKAWRASMLEHWDFHMKVDQWLLTAPTKLCFEKLMEVI